MPLQANMFPCNCESAEVIAAHERQHGTPSLYRLTFTVHMRGNHGADEDGEG